MYVTSHLCNARLMPGSSCSQYLLRFKCPWWWWWCYAPPPPGNSNGVQDRVFKVPDNNVSNEDSGTQAPVTYTINNINIRYNPCFIFAFRSDGGANVSRKLNAGYKCVDLCLVLPPCSQLQFMKSSPSRSDWVMKSEHDHAIIRTQYFSILYAGLYSWSIKPFWDI